MKINHMDVGNDAFSAEGCEKMKRVISKYGMEVVCNEEDEKKQKRIEADMVVPAGEVCENMKTVASKVGFTVVCDEE
jgi:hypothetical protein